MVDAFASGQFALLVLTIDGSSTAGMMRFIPEFA